MKRGISEFSRNPCEFLQLRLQEFQFLIQGNLAVELLLSVEAGGELVDLAAEAKECFATADMGGECFTGAGR
mgnify:CR=1 FL=1